jgi:hypothetical protein
VIDASLMPTGANPRSSKEQQNGSTSEKASARNPIGSSARLAASTPEQTETKPVITKKPRALSRPGNRHDARDRKKT